MFEVGLNVHYSIVIKFLMLRLHFKFVATDFHSCDYSSERDSVTKIFLLVSVRLFWNDLQLLFAIVILQSSDSSSESN